MKIKQFFEKKFKRSSMAASLTAALIIGGASGQAVAYEYGLSQLFVTNLSVVLSDDGGTTPGGGAVTNFDFNLINTAFLNGLGGSSTGNCSGTIASNTCGASPALDATVVNGTGSGLLQGENTFVINGPSSGLSYSNGDSIIDSSVLSGGATTGARQQAEAEINPGDVSASASSEVGSTTGFTMTFSVEGANQMTISMDALLNILAEINDPVAASASAKANTEVEFRLSNDSTGDFFTFRPDGALGNECAASAGLTCTTLSDEFDLNTDVNVTGIPFSTVGRSNTGANDHFSVMFSGLYDGIWTLGLAAKTSVQLSRAQSEVPEPGILALLGIGLLGFGVTSFRRKYN